MARIVSFSLDKEGLELLDKIEKARDYKNRSKLIRSALQLLLNDLNDLQKMKGHTSAVIVATHSEKSEEELSKLKHSFSDIITTQIHNNLHEICMETFIVHGNANTISSFARFLKESKAISYVKVITVAEDCL